MTSTMHTILVIGGTTGIGRSFAQRFHGQGKQVIVTGRPDTDRLSALSKKNPGIETYGFDITDVTNIPTHLDQLFNTYPDIDTVWINAGIQTACNLKDITSTTDGAVIEEITANLTGPLIIARHVIPRLLSRREAGKPATLMTTSSGIAFVPLGSMFPVYGATKAGIHHYTVGVRQALKGTGVAVIEIVPPYTEGTELGPGHKDAMAKMKGMSLEDLTDDIFAILDGRPAEELKEVAAGTGVDRSAGWRTGIEPVMVKLGLTD